MISTHMNHDDLRALAVTSQSICRSLLPEYLRRRGLMLKDKDTCAEGPMVKLINLGGYASLGLWSVSRIFHPPEEMYCSIPCDTREARSAMEFLMHFLLHPSNSRSLRDFQLSLRGSNPLVLTPKFAKMQSLFRTLPLTRLCFSGYGSVDCLPPSITLRSRSSCGSRTLTSLIISSDHAFAPGLVQTTMGILRHSPIKTLTIYMVSLNPSHWSTLLGELNMASLEDIELEGNIPRPALIRFLTKHRCLQNICIKGNVQSDRASSNRSRSQRILPNLLTLHAPLAVCCDIMERVCDSSSLYELQVEVGQLHPHHDPTFLRLVELLRHFRRLDHLGLQLAPCSTSTVPQTIPNDSDWDRSLVRALRQVRSLSVFRSQGPFSLGDIVRPHTLSLHISCLTHVIGHNLCLLTIISDAGNGPCSRRWG